MAEKGALITTWGSPRPGLAPGKGLEVFAKALTWYDELAKEGRISGYQVYACTTRERGMLIAEGDATELARITTEPEATTMLAMASAVVEDVCCEVFIGGKPDDVANFYTRTTQALTEAGLT
jgi:hypothetical protein